MDHPRYYREGSFIRDRKVPWKTMDGHAGVAFIGTEVTEFKLDPDGHWTDATNTGQLAPMEEDEIIRILETLEPMPLEDRRTYLLTLRRMEA